MMSLTEVWLVEGKEKLPVCLYFLRSMLLHHHRTHEPEHDLACLIFIFLFLFFLGKASDGKGQLICHLSATHFKATYYSL